MTIEQKNQEPLSLIIQAILWIVHPAIACFELPMRAGKTDLRMAIWLWHNDRDRDRGKACAICYVANGRQKAAILSFAPLFLIAGIVWLFGRNALPADIFVTCTGAAMAAVPTAFTGTGLLSIIGLGFALRKGIRVWIDEEPDLEFAMSNWPPVRSQKSIAPLFAIYPIFVILFFGLLATPDEWLYAMTACLLLFVPIILWMAHKACAQTPEECYGRTST